MPAVASTSPFWVTAFLDFTADDFAAGTAFWARVTGYGLSRTCGRYDEFTTLVPLDGDDFVRAQRLRSGSTRWL